MPEIRILPQHLVNKIAAGECVERPASVVKELVENALDAGATLVEIAVEDGGRRLISVRDNGGGMTKEDLALAFVPHATSKLASEDDLFNIRTLGFRGEALASIASVAHASIITRRQEASESRFGPRRAGAASVPEARSPRPEAASVPEARSPRPEAASGPEDCGYEIRADGETLSPVRPAVAPVGTTVTVRDLFFNTPARRKFMRTAETELGHVVEQLARLALPALTAEFRLTHNGRLVHHLPPAQELRRRVVDLFGSELGDGLIEFCGENAPVRVWGLLGAPSALRATTRFQYFFVNGRYVRDRLLTHALREAYRGLADPSRSPVGFVFLEVEPGEVDVNVHPTKIEVRFRNGQAVHSQLLGVARESLVRSGAAPGVQLGPGGEYAADRTSASLREPPDDQRRQSLKQALADFFKSNPPPQRGLDFARSQAGADEAASARVGTGAFVPFTPRSRRSAHLPPMERPGASEADVVGNVAAQPGGAPATVGDLEPATPSLSSGAAPPAMQIHDSYIVVATGSGLSIIDQHALHERLIFQDLLEGIGQGPLASQRLLIPQTLEVTQSDKAALAERAELLSLLGLEVTEFGPRSLAVQKFPSMLAARHVPPAEFLRDLLDLLAEPSLEREQLLTEALSAMACRAAVKAGQRLTPEEMETLLARREQVEASGSCPHGRPTTLSLTLEELEKQFRRT